MFTWKIMESNDVGIDSKRHMTDYVVARNSSDSCDYFQRLVSLVARTHLLLTTVPFIFANVLISCRSKQSRRSYAEQALLHRFTFSSGVCTSHFLELMKAKSLEFGSVSSVVSSPFIFCSMVYLTRPEDLLQDDLSIQFASLLISFTRAFTGSFQRYTVHFDCGSTQYRVSPYISNYGLSLSHDHDS